MSQGICFRCFEGGWKVARDIAYYGGSDAVFQGKAIFKKNTNNNFHYKEEGVLTGRRTSFRVEQKFSHEFEHPDITAFFHRLPESLCYMHELQTQFRIIGIAPSRMEDKYDWKYELGEDEFKLVCKIESFWTDATYITSFNKTIT